MDAQNLKVVKESDFATIFIYGVIGNSYFYDSEKEKANTDKNVVSEIKKLEKDFSRINIRINSPGGSVYHGNAIINAIANSTAEIHVYNDGLCASMAFVIWASSKNRHAAKNSTFMSHKPLLALYGNADDFRKTADILDVWQESLVANLSSYSSLSRKEIIDNFFTEDKYYSYEEIKNFGFIQDEAEDYEAAKPNNKNNTLPYLNISSKMRQDVAAISFPNIKKFKQVNKAEFKQAIENNQLAKEDIQEVLNELGISFEEEKPQEPQNNETIEELREMVKNQSKTIKSLTDKFENFSKKPGNTPTPTPIPPSDPDNEDEILDAFNKEMESESHTYFTAM